MALAERFGAGVIINVNGEDPAAAARELAGEAFRRGWDLIFEAAKVIFTT